jgi:ketosteroid isomerase-like protein
MNTLLRFSLITGLLTLGACAQQPPAYAERYSAALERYSGVTQSDGRSIDAFVRFFSGASAADDVVSARDLYAPALYFSDTLFTSEDHDAIVAHLERMHENTGGVDITVLDTLVDGPDVYLVWRMQARFRPAGKEVLSDTVGVTHLRFSDDGRIVLQQDFWDSTEGFYRHLPLVGSLVDSIAAGFSDDAR